MHARGRAARAASASPLVLAGLSSSMATRLDLPVLVVAVLAGLPRCGSAAACGTSKERFAHLCTNPQPTPGEGACIVNESVTLPPEWLKCEWASSGSLTVVGGVAIGCANRTTRCAYDPSLCAVTTCELSFQFDAGISIDERSSVRAGTVRLTSAAGRIAVGQGSSIDASGGGLCGRGSLSDQAPFSKHFGFGCDGAGHGGDGGSCTGGTGVPGVRHRAEVVVG